MSVIACYQQLTPSHCYLPNRRISPQYLYTSRPSRSRLGRVPSHGANCASPGRNPTRPSSCKRTGRLSLWRRANCIRGGGWQRRLAPSGRGLASSCDGRRRGRPCLQPRLSPSACRATRRLLGRALGGPRTYSESYGDETSVVRMHSGNGEHDEMDRRAVACFDQALADVGLADNGVLQQVLHDYFAWATTTTMSRYHHSADDVPNGLSIPRWSWDGLEG